MKNPSLISAAALNGPGWPMTGDGRWWVPARPLGMSGLHNRLRLAWLVFTGRADALVWSHGQ